VRRALALLPVLAALVFVPTALAGSADETALAEKYAPVVRLVAQPEECGPGEPYEPMDVGALFDEPTVALRGPWGGGDLIQVGPTASDLANGLYEYHLDFPGHALDPGCDYELWARRVTEGKEPPVYAHVAADPGFPGKLALQYWLFYAFNDWNNLHEGDWEMIQLVFDAGDAAEALTVSPTKIGYSQHEGAEESDWGDDKLELVGGTHPVVHPAAGSHANHYDEGLYLGNSAEQGVGCDDTTGPTYDVVPVVNTIPSDPAAARTEFPWIEYEGRWGELQRSFYNGPTGPNLKDQWTEPIVWSEDWRDRSYAVPAGGLLGTGATDFFCGAVGRGSTVLSRSVDNPWPLVVALGLLVGLALWGVSRATWRPGAPLRLARRRSWGQIVVASARMYRQHLRLLLGLGLLFVPILLLVSVLQWIVVNTSSILGIDTGGEGGGFLVLMVFALSTALTLLGVGFVQAATARALVEIDAGRRIGPMRAYRLALDGIRALLGSFFFAVIVVTLLASTLFLIPVAIWLAVRWSLIVPPVELESRSSLGAVRRSHRLVRGDWLKVGSLTVAAAGVALGIGPLVGALLIILTDAPFALLNAVSAVIYAATIPFVALLTVYVYFDVRVHEELEPAAEPGELPAEIQLQA
jgi:hypothetical protein